MLKPKNKKCYRSSPHGLHQHAQHAAKAIDGLNFKISIYSFHTSLLKVFNENISVLINMNNQKCTLKEGNVHDSIFLVAENLVGKKR